MRGTGWHQVLAPGLAKPLGGAGLALAGPDASEVILASTARSIVVAPIGFVCDNMEIVYDLDVEAAAAARTRGARLVRASTVTTSPGFVRMVRQLVEERLHPGAERAASGRTGPGPTSAPPATAPCRRPRAMAASTSAWPRTGPSARPWRCTAPQTPG